MEKDVINFGIGFVTGRSNVCKLINSYYNEIMEQLQRYSNRVNITIFILFDTTYQQTTREEFYNIKPEVYENIKISIPKIPRFKLDEDAKKVKDELKEKLDLLSNLVRY